MTVFILRNSKICNISDWRIKLRQISAARLAMKNINDFHGRFFRLRYISISRSGVADNTDILIEIDRIHLRKLTGSGDCFQNAHCHCNFHITLYGTGCTLFDQHGKCRDQHAVQFSGNPFGKAVIMGCHHAKLFFFHPLFKCNDIFCHIPYGLYRCTALDVKGIQNLLCLGADCGLICNRIRDCPYFLPVELFRIKSHPVVKIGFIDIQVHHSRIWSSDLGNIGVAESSAYLGCPAPLIDFLCHVSISAFYNTGDDGMTFARTLQIGYHLTDCSTGIQLTEPFWRIGIGIIRCFPLLHIHKHNRHIQVTDCREHIVAGRVGQKL